MRVLGVIPARYHSGRLPGKPLMDICGKTMIHRVYDCAKKARFLDEVIVATDDERILREVESFGGKAELTSDAHQTGFDRTAELAERYDCQYVACIHGDEPQIMPEIIDEVVGALLLDKKQNMTMACHEITGNRERVESRNVVKVVCDINGNALMFSRSPIPYPHFNPYYQVFEGIGVFAFTKEFLLRYVTLPKTPLSMTEEIEELKVTENGYPLKVIKTRFPYTPPSVNTPEELEQVRKLVKQYGLD